MKLIELQKQRQVALDAADKILARAEQDGKRNLTADESKLIDEHLAEAKRLNTVIQPILEKNTILALDPMSLISGGSPTAKGEALEVPSVAPEQGRILAAQFRLKFAGWMDNTLRSIGGGEGPTMEATAPSGPISIGTTSGWDSIGITVPVEVLPYMPSYFALDSFGNAGATQIFTPHTRPLVKPIISAGAADSVFAENAAPTTSQPFGLSSFTFNGTKYARLVLTSYESLMNSELPLQGVILDELLASMATTLTTAVTQAMFTALNAASSTLLVDSGGSNDIYSSMNGLRHAIPPRFDRPDNKWMLSRATLATIKNKRASTSGVPMFDATSNQIFGRDYVINDNCDSICGAGFVAFGNWAEGCWIRKTPLMTRVFTELYAQNGQIGYRTMQFLDQHFLAELAGAAQPPSYQPLFYTSIGGES